MIAVRVPLSMAAGIMVERDIVRHLFHRSTRAGIVTIVGALFLLSAQRAPLPSAREIVQRHVAAIGGEAAVKAVKSLRRRGKFEITGQNITAEFEELTARPDKLLLTADITGIGHTEEGVAGALAWTIDPQNGPRVLKDRERDEALAEADFDSVLHAANRLKELTTVGRADFDGHQTFKIKVVLVSGVEQDEYFDVESGLLIGTEARRATPLGVVPTSAMLRDYKKFGPLLQPTVLVQKALFIEQVLRISTVEYDVVPPNAFDPPAPIKALLK
jgi:hypothetical protein